MTALNVVLILSFVHSHEKGVCTNAIYMDIVNIAVAHPLLSFLIDNIVAVILLVNN